MGVQKFIQSSMPYHVKKNVLYFERYLRYKIIFCNNPAFDLQLMIFFI